MPITIELSGEGALELALQTLSDSTAEGPILDETAAILFSRVVTRFRDQVSADGTPWAPLAPRTIRERIKLGYGATNPILYRTGELLNSIQLATDGDSRYIGTSDPRAGILNAGGVTSEGGIIPARSFMDYNQEDADLMFQLVVRRITAAFGET